MGREENEFRFLRDDLRSLYIFPRKSLPENSETPDVVSYNYWRLARVVALYCMTGGAFAADPVDLSKLPPPAAKPIDYDRDIRPIFERSCFRCHGPERPKSGFHLDQRAPALKGGEDGVDILPGKSAESPLIHYVSS